MIHLENFNRNRLGKLQKKLRPWILKHGDTLAAVGLILIMLGWILSPARV